MFSIQESQLLERQDLLQKKAIYNLTIAGMEEPLSQMEEEAERIRAIHQDQTNVSIYG